MTRINTLSWTLLFVVGVPTLAMAQTTLPGKDFADAIFSVWLGAKPVDGDLKKGLLGKQ